MFGKLNKQAIYGGLVLVFLALAAYFVVEIGLPSWLQFIIPVSIVIFGLPTLRALRWWLGWGSGFFLALMLATLTPILLDVLANLAGFPYSRIGYSKMPEFGIFTIMPLMLVFIWMPLVLGAYSVAANLVVNRLARVLITAPGVLLFGFVLEPGFILLGSPFVTYGRLPYGVPMLNFAGWFVSGLIGAIIIEILIKRFKPLLPTPVQLVSSAIFIVFFWSAVAKHGGTAVPAIVGLGAVAALVVFYRKYHYSFDDKVVFVDESNKPIGTGDKLPSHTEDTKLHRAFSVFLFDPQGKFLMQQRALSKKTWPGVWSNSCCGHVMLHETTESAARRRLKFELGLTGIDLKLALPDFHYRAEKDGIVENEICPVFVGVTDRIPRPNPSEVETVKWVDWDEFVETLDDPETDISPWAVEEVRELLGSDVFRSVYPVKSAGMR